MKYEALKGLLDVLIKNYKCPSCGSKATEKNVEIMGTAGKVLNIDIECPSCSKHSMVKAEVAHLDVGSLKQDDMELLRKNLDLIKGKIKEKFPNISDIGISSLDIDSSLDSQGILDSEIINLDKKLKKRKFSVSDLFSDDN